MKRTLRHGHRMVVYACPRCASQNLHAPTIADGGILGYSTTAQQVCEDCGFQGAALEFDAEADHQAFRRAVEAGEHPLAPEDLRGQDDEQATPDRGLQRLQETRAPSSTQRGTAAFIVLVGAAAFFVILLFGGGMLVRPESIAVFVAGILVILLGFAEAVAVLFIARRLWRGSGRLVLDDPDGSARP